MGRKQITKKFWASRPATLHSMFLHGQAPELDVLERAEIFSYLPPYEEKIVLDLACGIGRFTEEFAKRAKRVVAVDFNPTFLEENRQRNARFPHIDYVCSDALDLHFAPESFDLVFISWLFLYLTDKEVQTLVKRLASWLKPGGYLFFRESCAATRKKSQIEGYFALYRCLIDYPRFFPAPWQLIREGNIACFEDLLADPFKCFWLYRNNPKNREFAKAADAQRRSR